MLSAVARACVGAPSARLAAAHGRLIPGPLVSHGRAVIPQTQLPQRIAQRYMSQEAAAAVKPKRRFLKTKIFLSLWALAAIADNVINDDWDTLVDRIRPRLSAEQRKDRPHIVILGTGWGALSMLRKLRADHYNVTIVSPRNYFLFTPLLPSTTTGTINIQAIIEPIRDYCRRANAGHAVIYEAECEVIDPDTNTVKCVRKNQEGVVEGQFELKYDQLVVATGCEVATFGIPGVREHAYFMKEAHDARRLRARIINVLEMCNLPGAEKTHDLDKLLHFVVVGGGPTGVECAAELHDLVNDEVGEFFPKLAGKVRITLVEAQAHVLSMFSRSLVEFSEEKFRRQAINLLPNALVTGLDENYVNIKHLDTKESERIPYGTLLWASGINTRPVVKNLIEKIGKDNGQTSPRALCVDEHLRVKGTKNIWAIGDAAFCGLAPTAQVAFQEGKYLGRLLRHGSEFMYEDRKSGGATQAFDQYLSTANKFDYQHMGSFAYLGDHSAIADFSLPSKEQVGPLGTSAGVVTYFLWRSVYFTKLLSFRNRMLLGVNWCFTFFFGRDTSRSR